MTTIPDKRNRRLMRILLDGVEVGQGYRAGEAAYVFWNRVQLTTELTIPPDAKAHWQLVGEEGSTVVDLAPAYKLEVVSRGFGATIADVRDRDPNEGLPS
jgi:hypothetical protein